MDIAIIGGGAWARALYAVLEPKSSVKIVSRSRHEGISQCSLQESASARFLIVAIASSALRGWLEQAKLPKDTHILAACKGIEEGSGALLSDIFEEFLPRENLAYLAGPSFAKEVREGLPCALTIHSYNSALATEMASFFPTHIRLYVDDDVIGGEVSGAYKNVIAIAGGICDGLMLGANAKASLIARGLVEMARFGEHFGARSETFLGLSGAGDLFLTSSSTLSRNYRVGIGLAEGKSLERILSELGEVAEGIKTAKAITQIAKVRKIHAPIACEVHAILEGKDPKESLRDLLSLGRVHSL